MMICASSLSILNRLVTSDTLYHMRLASVILKIWKRGTDPPTTSPHKENRFPYHLIFASDSMTDLLNREIFKFVALGLIGASALIGQTIIEQEAEARCYGPAFSAHCETILNK